MKKILTTLFVTLGSLLSQAQFSNYQWHQVIGGAGNEQIKCMKADASGNVYLAGYLKSNCLGTVSMPYSGFSGSSYSDGFIVKLNSNGTVAWTKTFPGVNSGGVIQMQAITVSTSGEVYFAGVVYGGDADIDPGASQTIISAPTVSQGFIGKLDASGNYVWGGGISNVESFCNILLTPQGEVAYAGTYTSGSTNVTSNFPVDYNISATNTSYAHTYRIGPFIVKYTPSGSYVHTLIESNGGALYEPGLVSDAFLRDVTMNSAGEFYITGTKYVYSFGTLATRKMYYQKVPTNYVQGPGSWVFPNTGQVGLNANELGYKNAYAYGITCDANDNIYISGFFNGGSSDPLDFDPSAATSNQFTDQYQDAAFVAKYDSNLNFLNFKKFHNTGIIQSAAYDVVADNNRILLLGNFTNTIDLDPSAATVSATSNGGFDIFLVELDNNLNYLNSMTFGSSTANAPSTEKAVMLAKGGGSLYLASDMEFSIDDVDPGTAVVPATSAGGYDGLVMKLNQSFALPLANTTATLYNRSQDVLLQWTPNNVNPATYVIERSGENGNWTSVGEVDGRTRAMNNNYEFIDKQPLTGTSWYRIAWQTVDGNRAVSNIVKAVRVASASIEYYPNPTTMQLHIRLSETIPTQVQIISLDGKVQLETTIDQSTPIDLSALTRGTYIIRCSNPNQTTTGRIMKN